MILHRLPRFASQFRRQFTKRTCIFKLHQGARPALNDSKLSSPINLIELDSVENSIITGVSVYPNRAEITRLFKFDIAAGQNKLKIIGLPVALDRDSLRVEGRGAAIIDGVTISENVTFSAGPLKTLNDKLCKKRDYQKSFTDLFKVKICHLKSELERLKSELERLERLRDEQREDDEDEDDDDDDDEDVEDDDEEEEEEAAKEVERTENGIEKRTENLIAKFDKAIDDEITNLSGLVGDSESKLNPMVSIGVSADFESRINIALVYAVHSVTWNAGYDISVDTKKKDDKPVTLIYKAGITQDSGEDWKDVPLTLETAPPSLKVPTLSPWNIQYFRQPPMKSDPEHLTLNAPSTTAAPMQDHVSSTGNVSATFHAPGLISIPSDGISHDVTIAKLDLDAKMSWVCVPKEGATTYFTANIKNTSPYTFLGGPSSVNVDGNIISKSDVPLVGLEESFDCPLNVDPSIRVKYHPRSVKVSQSGIYTKITKYLFSQRITIANTKTVPIENLKIIDQIPVSEDPRISVKLVNPALGVPGTATSTSSSANWGERKVLPPVSVASGVVAQWHGADEGGVEVETLGRDGKLNWVCAVPAQEQIGLVLEWEVVAPQTVKTAIQGLTS